MTGVLLPALLVLGTNLTLYGLVALVRGRGPAPVVSAAVPDPSAVAVLIAAHDQEDLVGRAVRAAARPVPPENVHVVSDDSADRTADAARECVVQVAETMGRLGRAGAFDGAIQAFRLVDLLEFHHHGPHPRPGAAGQAGRPLPAPGRRPHHPHGPADLRATGTATAKIGVLDGR